MSYFPKSQCPLAIYYLLNFIEVTAGAYIDLGPSCTSECNYPHADDTNSEDN